MFLCSIDGFPTEEKTHEQDEDLYQRGFFHLPLVPLLKIKGQQFHNINMNGELYFKL